MTAEILSVVLLVAWFVFCIKAAQQIERRSARNGAPGCPQRDEREAGRPAAPLETDRILDVGKRAAVLLANALGPKYLAALHPIAPAPVTAPEGMTAIDIRGDDEHVVEMVRELAERLRESPVERFYEVPLPPIGRRVHVKSRATGIAISMVSAGGSQLRLSVCCQRRRVPARVISGRELLTT